MEVGAKMSSPADVFVHGLDEALSESLALVSHYALHHAFIILVIFEPSSDGILDLLTLIYNIR